MKVESNVGLALFGGLRRKEKLSSRWSKASSELLGLRGGFSSMVIKNEENA
jgi:hypothetical protein